MVIHGHRRVEEEEGLVYEQDLELFGHGIKHTSLLSKKKRQAQAISSEHVAFAWSFRQFRCESTHVSSHGLASSHACR